MSLTLSCSFSFSQIWDPPMEQAWAEAVTMSSYFSCPLSTASMVKSSVITLVTLAGSSCLCSSLANRTVPVSFSISSADGADTSTARAPVVSSSAAHSSAIPLFMMLPLLLVLVG